MFTIYHSNHLDLLKDLLVDLIRRDPLPNPLDDEQILVQSPGMAQWLRQELAEGLGIAAGLKFPLPASFLWDMFVRVLPEVPTRSAFNKEAMTWKLVNLLPTLIQREHFAPLQQYLQDDPDGIRCYQLAGKVADIMDQYLVYRPDWIAEWEKGLDSHAEEQLWQPDLWRELVTMTESLGQPHWHRANMHHQFIEKLAAGDHHEDLPRRLFVFGISALPPHFVETLNALGQQIDVHLLVCNPCRYYWGDEKDPKYLAKLQARFFAQNSPVEKVQSDLFEQSPFEQSNPLLASMGKLGRDYLHQLHDLEASEILAFVDGKNDTLLHRVQTDILELKDNSQSSSEFAADPDASLVFHSCHSPMREVEVLHDQLLNLFDTNPELTPKDVIVMLPDVDQYSPWIQAVFGGLKEGRADERYIPFSISDRSAQHEHPVLSGLLRLLDIDNSRCTASELLELLEIPALQRQFGFNEEGFETIRQWVDQAGIRWGLSPEHQQGFDLPPRDSNSWLFGLRRMLLGYAMPEVCGLYEDILPLDTVQGMDAVLSGQLADFIEQTEMLARTLSASRPIEEWTLVINQLMERFFQPDESDEYALKLVRDSLQHLREQLQDAACSEPLSRAILLDYLTERLTSERSSQKFLAGQVNFCTLMPMRSIPFKVVCLLGMNDGAYPRSMPPTGFDLIAQQSRRGDRSRREDDRYLFLEAMLSARDTFYVSYVGHNIKDNSARVPSVLVTELQDYCSYYFKDQLLPKEMIIQHPLQSFSPDNFTPQSQSFSYAHEWLPAATRSGTASQPFMSKPLSTQELPEDIELTELLRFYRNPCQHFCNRRLRVFFEQGESSLEDTEPFMMDGLEAYQLKQSITESLLSEADMNAFEQRLQATGRLPHGAFGELLLEDQYKAVNPLVEQVKTFTLIPVDDIEINLNFGKRRLTGWLKQCYRSGLIRFRPAKIKTKDLLYAWIEHLCYTLSCDQADTTRQIGIEGSASFEPVSREFAQEQLDRLIGFYLEGHSRPLPFFSETASALLAHDEPDKARDAAKTTFYGGFRKTGEIEDSYIHRIYPDLDTVITEVEYLAEEILKPMQQYLELSKGAQS